MGVAQTPQPGSVATSFSCDMSSSTDLRSTTNMGHSDGRSTPDGDIVEQSQQLPRMAIAGNAQRHKYRRTQRTNYPVRSMELNEYGRNNSTNAHTGQPTSRFDGMHEEAKIRHQVDKVTSPSKINDSTTTTPRLRQKPHTSE